MFKSLSRRLALILGALSLMVPVAIATSPSASAFQPFSDTAATSNALSVASCTFKVSSYSTLTHNFTGRLVGTIAPKSFATGLASATVYIGCVAYGNTNPEAYVNGSRLQNGSSTSFNKAVTMPYDSSFTVCVYAQTVSRGGVTYTAPFNCH
ncbi:hypothetical protein [Nocardioides marmorisolisilvae]|uniref:Uncharacterized protein n=1 Tax=Nocardioides marmorisolisilvae TaxID=1542737 RepID=A0A3N0DTB1_9ACTN|nr:hypothetical protein [Nocardioides marmorisolisilvae]RNL78852.1 hypothetical protein EFL95_07255 [Nocardioides marmorisolisilvae]